MGLHDPVNSCGRKDLHTLFGDVREPAGPPVPGKGATRWKRNVRLAKPWVQVIFIACATMMFTGMCWLVIVPWTP